MARVTSLGDKLGPRRLVVVSLLLCCVIAVAATASPGAAQSDANGSVEGVITDAANQPISGATVSVKGHTDLEATTDGSGSYAITDVPYDEQTLVVTHDRYEEAQTDIAVSTTNSPVTEHLTLDRKTGTVTGTIEGESGPMEGEPLPGVSITVTHTNSRDQTLLTDPSTDFTDRVTTDGSGQYTLEVPTGDIGINTTQDGFESNHSDGVTVTANESTTANLDLTPVLVTVNGTVTNTGGDSIAGATVSIDSSTGIWPGIDSADLTATTDQSGTYEIETVPATTTGNERKIGASADTFQMASTTTPIPNSGLTHDFELTHDDNDITGTVTDTNGNELHNVSVQIEDAPEYHSKTTADGSYRLSDVPFGTHSLVVEHDDYEAVTKSVEVERTAESTAQQDFTLSRATSVRLSINDVWTDLGQADETVTIQYTFDEEVEDEVTLTVEGPSSTLADRTVTVGHSPDSHYSETIQIPAQNDVEDGSYTAEISALGETTSSSFTVSNAFQSGSVEFSQDRYQSPAGDFVAVDISMDDDVDEAYLLLGGDRESGETALQNHLDVLHVTGDVSFVINTRLVGTDAPSESVYIPTSDGDVTSYAHSIGAATEPEGVFSDVSFQNHRGTEVANTLAEFRNEVDLTSRGSPIQAGRYRLVAGRTGTVMTRNDGIPDFRHPVDRSNLVLTQPELGDVNTYVLPPGPANQLDRFDEESEPLQTADIGTLRAEATETDTIARGDRILIEVRGSGTFGALLAGATDHPAINDEVDYGSDTPGNIDNERVAALLERHEGVRIELAHRALGAANNPGSNLQFSDIADSDLYVLPDDSAFQWENGDRVGDAPVIGGLYFVVDTRGADPFDNQPRDGDELTFEMAYESPEDERYQFQDYSLVDGEQPAPFKPAVKEVDGVELYPYFGDDDTTVRTNDSFGFEDPFVEYKQTGLDRELMVPDNEGGVITGTTNIAPGSEATVQLIASNRPEPTTITVEDVTIGEDGDFEIVHDFSELEPGERVEVEFYTPQRLVENRLLDKRGAIVVDDLDEPAYFAVSNLTAETTVTQGERLDSIQGTITNTGEVADRQMVEFTIDGETVFEQSVTLDSEEQTTLDLSEQFVVLPPGEYPYTLRTADDEQSGQLVVTEANEENVTATDPGTTTPTTEDATDENEDTEEEPTTQESDNDEESDTEENDNQEENDDQAEDNTTPFFGIGTRETFGGTVLVGATYLLGHWV